MDPTDGEKLFRDKSVLVTGGSGFVGQHLVKRLALDGAKVYSVSRNVPGRASVWGVPPIEKYFQLDLANFNDVMHVVTVAEPDYVFHLGAVTQVTEARHWPIHTFRVNALGTMHILEACRAMNKSEMCILIASSDKAYGEPLEDDLPLKETNRLRPVHPYDLSKSSADLIAQSYAKYFNMQIQITRMANIYGPGDTNWKRLIPGFVRWALEGKQGTIRSDGKQLRQYLYIDDAIEGYYNLAHQMRGSSTDSDVEWIPNGEVWNFAPDIGHKTRTVVELIYIDAVIRGITAIAPFILSEAQDETPVLLIDNYKAKLVLLWKPDTDLREGISHTFDWATQYLSIDLKARKKA